MNACIPCLASRDADALAHQQGEYDAEDSFLDAYVQIHYGPDYAPEFVIEAMKEIPFDLAKVIAELKDYKAQGEAIENWLSKYAYQCARRDMQEARNA
ncbi:hypothetical protein Daci_4120 [Delftia acidovorans SPH-1]|uniref:Uncharacterized protein n=1 Tax=Delftia acidovorans (strain DSM 14801 / SPH-1) TaxID=398578 RepID=A9BW32_DELAS|nr:hypothetical protein [Delftia acidovorans]ABX35848.1 hypothetical protein Daci_3210 [Delftia acidovorans SPH-1]ABX36751.1 hypothetical protein Daci_4120 [Delftia acidovorans SPH-1]QPS73988.1 hypothetical protein I6G48_25655 [Delftia acidovorans]QPS74876.1 hypothetical protein I6G48_30450 [Delftia acidovorans]